MARPGPASCSGLRFSNPPAKGADMKRCPPLRRFAALVAAILLATLIAVSAFGQAQFGNIYGKVQAKDGTMLPGVTVTLSGVAAPQTFITDSEGNFRFLNLSPSSDYELKAELT